MNPPVLELLREIVGEAQLRVDPESCVLYAQDVYTRDLPALAVVSPGNLAELAKVVPAITDSGHAVIARGGGMSYTSGYVPQEADSIIVDMQRMDRVLDVNTEDMYVTVECGCSWIALNQALAKTGYRTAYWGTLSGIHATVGGSLSQNSIFWGSGRHGTAADAVIGMQVVLADGRVLTTGSASRKTASPFFRHYGPDLTGLYSCDAGALGIKATATLRLVPVPEHREQLSFSFTGYSNVISAMSQISRAALADECFAFDPNLQSIRMQRESLASDMRKLVNVAKSSKSVFSALKDSARITLAGRGFMKADQYSLHVMLEERSRGAADANTAAVRRICVAAGGKEIENSIPKILRANPFTPLNNVAGPNGERWFPVHAILPHSKAESTLRKVEAVFDRHAALMEQHEIGHGYLLATISTNGFVIEPVFFTPDSLNELHKATIEPSVLRTMSCFESRPEAQVATAQIRRDMISLFEEVGGIHMQIGKSYPYRQGLRAESLQVIEAVKNAVDPERRVNPGCLGLD